MTITVEAVYQNGQFQFKEPVQLAEGTPVRVTITTVEEETDPLEGIIGICETGRTDGAANHDKYLYGKRPMIFVDTWEWIALADRSAQFHVAAKKQHRKLLKKRNTLVTSDFVATEFINYLYSVAPAHQAQAVIDSFFEKVDGDSIKLAHVSPEQFRQAWKLRRKYRDKPDISMIDFTSMVVMQDLGISDVFTGDHHFLHVNLGFRLLP